MLPPVWRELQRQTNESCQEQGCGVTIVCSLIPPPPLAIASKATVWAILAKAKPANHWKRQSMAETPFHGHLPFSVFLEAPTQKPIFIWPDIELPMWCEQGLAQRHSWTQPETLFWTEELREAHKLSKKLTKESLALNVLGGGRGTEGGGSAVLQSLDVFHVGRNASSLYRTDCIQAPDGEHAGGGP